MSEHELWNELGNLYFLSGAYAQAVHAYNRSIALDAEFGRPYSNLALAYVQQGKFQEAIELYRRSIELLSENRERAISWNRLGNVYRYLKDYREALVAYQQADELDPESGEANDQPGWAAEPGQPAKAGDEKARHAPSGMAPEGPTETWAATDPQSVQLNVSQAPEPGSLTTWGEPGGDSEPDPGWEVDGETEVYFPDPEADDLSKWLPIPELAPSDALDLAPDEVHAELEEPPSLGVEMVGDAVLAEGGVASGATRTADGGRRSATSAADSREAEAGVQVAVSVRDDQVPEFVLQADAVQEEETAQRVGEVQSDAQTLEYTTTTTVVAPEGQGARDEEETRQIEQGLIKFKRVVQLNPRNAHAWDTLGNLYKSAGMYKEAVLAYEEAIKNDPSKPQYHHHLGLIYASEGRMEEAVDAFQQVITIDPDHGLAHATLGGYYRKMGLEELAQKHIGIAMKSVFDSENEYNRACLAAIVGDKDQALQLLRVALANKQTYVDWILRDPDLDFIRQDPRFKQLISDYAR
jgi:tetratricopeptide (TPR) repeat protein